MSKKNILIADDFSTQRNIVRMTVEKTDANVLEADNGQRALQLASEKPLDLIITDYEMPGMDGIDLSKQIRTGANNNNVPIIMITSNNGVKTVLIELI